MEPSKSQVKAYMKLVLSECESVTELVEMADVAFDLPEYILDDPKHWIWDLGYEVFDQTFSFNLPN